MVAAMTKNQPFFTHDRDSDTFMPTPVSNGPWTPIPCTAVSLSACSPT